MHQNRICVDCKCKWSCMLLLRSAASGQVKLPPILLSTIFFPPTQPRPLNELPDTASHYHTLQHCNCNDLQHTSQSATHCNMLQNTEHAFRDRKQKRMHERERSQKTEFLALVVSYAGKGGLRQGAVCSACRVCTWWRVCTLIKDESSSLCGVISAEFSARRKLLLGSSVRQGGSHLPCTLLFFIGLIFKGWIIHDFLANRQKIPGRKERGGQSLSEKIVSFGFQKIECVDVRRSAEFTGKLMMCDGWKTCLCYVMYTVFVFHSYFVHHLTLECLNQKTLETQFSSSGKNTSTCFLAHSKSKKSARKRRSTTQTLQRQNWQNTQKCTKSLIFPKIWFFQIQWTSPTILL